MKKIFLIFVFLISYSFAFYDDTTCSQSFGDGWILDSVSLRTPHDDNHLSCSSGSADPDYCQDYLDTHDDDFIVNDDDYIITYNTYTEPIYHDTSDDRYKVWKETYSITCILDDNSTCNDDEEEINGECYPKCPNYSTRNSDDMSCTCNYGYDMSTDTCLPPKCLTEDKRFDPPLPLYKVTDDCNKCNPFEMSDSSCARVEDVACCYGQEGVEDNSTCGVDEIEIDGKCYPVEHQDNNKTDDKDYTCPTGEYYSFETNKCEPFFDDNNSDNSSSDDNSTGNGNSSDNNGTGGDDNAPNVGDFEKAISPFLDKGKDVLNSYVLIDIPIQISGSDCSGSLRENVDIMGHTYTIDLTPYMSQVDKSLSWIQPLVIFMFGFSAVIIVLSNKD